MTLKLITVFTALNVLTAVSVFNACLSAVVDGEIAMLFRYPLS